MKSAWLATWLVTASVVYPYSPIGASDIPRLDPPYEKVRGSWLRTPPIWSVHDTEDIVSAQMKFNTHMTYREFDYWQCQYRLIDANTVEVWQVQTGQALPDLLIEEPAVYEKLLSFRYEIFEKPRSMTLKSLFGTGEQLAFGKVDVVKKSRYVADQLGTTTEIVADPLYFSGRGRNIASWNGVKDRGEAPSIMLNGETCLKLARSIPGDDPLSGTIRTLANQLTWTIM